MSIGGCENAQEKCNRAKVAANDGWASYLQLVEKDDAAQAADQTMEKAKAAVTLACMAAWSDYVVDVNANLQRIQDPTHRMIAAAGALADVEQAAKDRKITALKLSPEADAAARRAAEVGPNACLLWADGSSDSEILKSDAVLAPLIAKRKQAIKVATDAFLATGKPLVEQSEWTQKQLESVRTAKAQSMSGAVAARDAAKSVQPDKRHPEQLTAAQLSATAWEACQVVAP